MGKLYLERTLPVAASCCEGWSFLFSVFSWVSYSFAGFNFPFHSKSGDKKSQYMDAAEITEECFALTQYLFWRLFPFLLLCTQLWCAFFLLPCMISYSTKSYTQSEIETRFSFKRRKWKKRTNERRIISCIYSEWCAFLFYIDGDHWNNAGGERGGFRGRGGRGEMFTDVKQKQYLWKSQCQFAIKICGIVIIFKVKIMRYHSCFRVLVQLN